MCILHAHRVGAKDKAAIDFAVRLAKDSHSSSEKDFQALNELGFDNEEVMEIIAMSGMAVFYNHLVSGELTYASKSISAVFGLSEKEVINKLWQNSVNWLPDSIDQAEEMILRMATDRESFVQHEMQFIHPDGTQKTIRVSSHPVMDKDNNVISIDGMVEGPCSRKLKAFIIAEKRTPPLT